MRATRRPGTVVVGALAASAVLAAGGFLGVRAYTAHAEQEQREASCRMIQDTESLYAKQRQTLSGPKPELAFLGDSYSEGLYISSPVTAFPYHVAAALGTTAVVNGVGGSGYIAGGPCRGQQLATRLHEVIATQPRVLVIQAGINDRGKAGVGEAARELFAEAKRLSPQTTVVALGPFAPKAAVGTELDDVARSVETAAREENVSYIDPRAWEYPLLSDGLHPTESGHKVIADQLAAVLPVVP